MDKVSITSCSAFSKSSKTTCLVSLARFALRISSVTSGEEIDLPLEGSLEHSVFFEVSDANFPPGRLAAVPLLANFPPGRLAAVVINQLSTLLQGSYKHNECRMVSFRAGGARVGLEPTR